MRFHLACTLEKANRKLNAMKIRLDKLLVDQGHAASRERAQALILAGRVLVDEQRVDKPGTAIAEDATIRLLGSDLKYVSRGGLKLEKALEHWKIDLTNLRCVDIGASTGGFTDCMLQSGAASVLAVDTGYGQIAQKLRDDPRVTLRERTNARLLTAGELLDAANRQPSSRWTSPSSPQRWCFPQCSPHSALQSNAGEVAIVDSGQAAVRGRTSPRRQRRDRPRS